MLLTKSSELPVAVALASGALVWFGGGTLLSASLDRSPVRGAEVAHTLRSAPRSAL